MLHGLASNARIWELVAPSLEELGYNLIAPDARSHGLSDGPDGDYGFDTYFKDLAHLIDFLGIEQPILIGHSWGAHRALDYAARVPFGPRAPAGIILVDGGMGQLNYSLPGAKQPTWEAVLERLTPPRLAGASLDEFTSRILSMIQAWNVNPELIDQVVSIILENFSIYLDEDTGIERISPHLSFEKHIQIVRSLWEFQTFEEYDRVRCPVLMIPARPHSFANSADEAHLAAKEYGISLAAKRIQKLQVNWFKDTIHDVPLQRPAALSAQIAQFCLNL